MIDHKLKVPHAIEPKKGEMIAQILNGLVADIFALYVKTKNYHWHLVGPHFRDYHLLCDEQASQLFEMIDPVAERVRKLGFPTITSIGHIQQMKSLSDDNDLGLAAQEMLKRLLRDNQALAHVIRQAHEVAEKHSDFATTSLLEIYLDETEKRIWFLAATVA